MIPKRKRLIEKFQEWFYTNPLKSIAAYECANIAEEYAKQEAKELAIWISKKGFFITEDGSDKWLQVMDTLGEDPKTFDELYKMYDNERREK